MTKEREVVREGRRNVFGESLRVRLACQFPSNFDTVYTWCASGARGSFHSFSPLCCVNSLEGCAFLSKFDGQR